MFGVSKASLLPSFDELCKHILNRGWLFDGWGEAIGTKRSPLVAYPPLPESHLACAFKILWGRVVSYPPSFADSQSAGGWNSGA